MAARAAITHTERLGSRKNVDYFSVKDSMRMRSHLVASAHRHLPCLVSGKVVMDDGIRTAQSAGPTELDAGKML